MPPMPSRRQAMAGALLAATQPLTLWANPAWPTRTVRFIVPFPPGGPVDTTARVFSPRLAELWKVPTVIDNRAGAGGVVGATAAAKEAPDGHALFVAAIHHSVNPSLMGKLPYDIEKDFQPVALVSTGNMLLAALLDLGVLEPRFGWGELPDQGVVMVAGPPRYVSLLEATLKQLPPGATAQQVMVFRLRHASAEDRVIMYRDQRIVQPGLAGLMDGSVSTLAPLFAEYARDRRKGERFGDFVAVGLDVRGTTLAARGWTKDGGDLFEVLARLEADGCARYVVTDVTKDGTLRGPNLELLKLVMERTEKPVVALITEWMDREGNVEKRNNDSDLGGTMRLGSQRCPVKANTLAYRIYGAEVNERHRHRYEVNNKYRDQIAAAGVNFSGTYAEKNLVEFVELPREVHPYYVGTQAHPELRSRPTRPHPLFSGLIAAAIAKKG